MSKRRGQPLTLDITSSTFSFKTVSLIEFVEFVEFFGFVEFIEFVGLKTQSAVRSRQSMVDKLPGSDLNCSGFLVSVS